MEYKASCYCALTNEPITEDDFVYGLDKIDVMIKRWSDVGAIEDINIDYATRRFGQ